MNFLTLYLLSSMFPKVSLPTAAKIALAGSLVNVSINLYNKKVMSKQLEQNHREVLEEIIQKVIYHH